MSSIETPPRETAPPDAEVITAEVVAKTIAGIAQIGVAHRTLQQAGHEATLTGNRIIVAGIIEATLNHCGGHGTWSVFALDGSRPVWTVGTSPSDPATWVGCLE